MWRTEVSLKVHDIDSRQMVNRIERGKMQHWRITDEPFQLSSR
ncbi:MAG: hypothetical protein WAO35_25680 [Terriglobia bacterium]